MARNVIVITGTSRGIGYELALYFLEKKEYIVVGCSRGLPTISNENYKHYQLDVTNEIMVQEWARKVKKELQRVDILVCNVGLVSLGYVVGGLSLSVFRSFVDSILVSTFLVCREFSKIMAVQRSGRIINITSTLANLHMTGTSAYASSKVAVTEFTKILAQELSQYGVTCNLIAPSLVNTEAANEFGQKWRERVLEKHAIKRAIEPKELGHIVEFFSDKRSSIVTGQVINTCLIN